MASMRSGMGEFVVELSEKVPFTENGATGHRVRVCGKRSGRVECIVDLAKLEQYAKRALLNKRGYSQIANGGVKFKVIKDSVAEVRT